MSVLIGLGGNVGDVFASMQSAIDTLNNRADCTVRAVSDVYRTPPWGVTDQDWFLNACADLSTTLEPEPLLDVLLGIERETGRVRDHKWGPRTLDLDIIAYGHQTIDSAKLTVPHPRLAERAFVLVPLMDIAPERNIGDLAVRDYMDNLGSTEVIKSQMRLRFRPILSS